MAAAPSSIQSAVVAESTRCPQKLPLADGPGVAAVTSGAWEWSWWYEISPVRPQQAWGWGGAAGAPLQTDCGPALREGEGGCR